MRKANIIEKMRTFKPFLKYMNPKTLLFLKKWMKNERMHVYNNKVRLNSFFPPSPSTPHKRFIKAAFSKERTPLNVYISTTNKCPYDCPHCSYKKRPEEEISTKEFYNIIDQIKELGTPTIGFTGGEPLLRKDIEKLIEYSKPELNTIIFTTGYSLTRKKAEKLKKAGIDCVTVGIESSNPEKHNKIRNNKESFNWLEKSVKNCVDAEIYTAISTIGFREKIENIYILGEKCEVGELRLLNPVATGGIANKTEVILNSNEIEKLKEFHKKHNRKNLGPVVESFAYIESSELFGCGAGFHHMFIDAAGNVCPCDLTPLSFGNIKEKKLKDIWVEMGKYFPRPRLNCFMNSIADKIPKDTNFPISKKQSITLFRPAKKDDPLPEWYKHVLKK